MAYDDIDKVFEDLKDQPHPSVDISAFFQKEQDKNEGFPDSSTVHDAIRHPTDPELSETARSLLGKHIPENSRRSCMTSLREFSRFLTKEIPLLKPPDPKYSDYAEMVEIYEKRVQDQAVGIVRLQFFCDEDGTQWSNDVSSWSQKKLQKLNNALIEFIAHKKNSKNGKELSSGTWRTYLAGLQRGMKIIWGFEFNFFNGSVFSDVETGLSALWTTRLDPCSRRV